MLSQIKSAFCIWEKMNRYSIDRPILVFDTPEDFVFEFFLESEQSFPIGILLDNCIIEDNNRKKISNCSLFIRNSSKNKYIFFVKVVFADIVNLSKINSAKELFEMKLFVNFQENR